MTTARTDNFYNLDSHQHLPYHTSVFSSSWAEAAQVPSLVAPSSPEEEGQISPCSFSDDPMLGYPWQQLPPSPSSHMWSPKTDDEEYVPHHIKLKPESLYPSPLLPPSSGILSTQDILDIDSPLLESLLVKDIFPSQPPEPKPLDITAESDQDDSNINSEVDCFFSEDDEDEEETFDEVLAAWPATLSHTNSFSTENNEESEYEDEEEDDMVQHPWNRLLADLREQIGKPIKEHDFMQLHQHVKETLEQCDDGAFPEIRECILDCVNILRSYLVPEDEDEEEEVPHRRRGARCRRRIVESSASDDDDDDDDEEDDWTPEEEEEDVPMSASYERRARRSSTTSSSSSSSSLSSSSSSSSSYRGLSKKTRKNYSRETTRVLMNWYLTHGGKTPEPEHKEILAKQANKSHVQISTWFQNARRRHHPKLIQYQKLHKEYPDEVYDYDSLIAFTERTDRRKRAAPDTDDEYDSEAGSSPSPKRTRK
ncbi:hypothetical protein BJV82DRAFT_618565 [Fennellomyces sp. T-0311]|nr:hypothetical protein BJV82DRAFT_618565 [Fennellomyces sp. T-0311]